MNAPCQVEVREGTVAGIWHDGVRGFFSVPYAAPPVGPLRFAAPAPPERWAGVRNASRSGATAPHKLAPFPGIDMAPIVGRGWIRGDDYLTLNVWTPADAAGRPVLVYIHGGGLVLGSKDAPVYDGTGFARSGVVQVAINYRLGIEGFLPIPGAATNIGLRDALAALDWVRDNIAAFGGDPGNITISGESGGAMLVADLVASPLAAGLFRRAILMSGHGSAVVSRAVGEKLVRKIAEILKVAPDVEGFRSASAEACVAAATKVMRPGAVDLRDERGFDSGFGQGKFNPVHGDDVLPARPLDLLRQGAGKDVELLVGTTRDEANFLMVPTRMDRFLPGFAAKWLLGKAMPDAGEALKAYGLGQRGQRAGEVLSRALTDLAFAWPARQFAEAHQGRSHCYMFDWGSDACNGRLGACHGLDLAFVFDTLPTIVGPKGAGGSNPPQALADRMHGLFVRFVTDGAVPWQPFDGDSRLVHHLWADDTVTEAALPAARFLP